MVQIMGSVFVLLMVMILCNVVATKWYGDKTQRTGAAETFGACVIIGIIYCVFVSLYGFSGGVPVLKYGIPFADKLDVYGSITAIFKFSKSAFVFSSVELFTLTFIMTFLIKLIPDSFGGEGFSGMILAKLLVLFVGIIINGFLIETIKNEKFFTILITTIECFLCGGSFTLTPIMIVSNIFHLDPSNIVVSYIVYKLPETKIGKCMSSSVINTIVFITFIIIIEKKYGSVLNIVTLSYTLFAAFLPILVFLLFWLATMKYIIRR